MEETIEDIPEADEPFPIQEQVLNAMLLEQAEKSLYGDNYLGVVKSLLPRDGIRAELVADKRIDEIENYYDEYLGPPAQTHLLSHSAVIREIVAHRCSRLANDCRASVHSCPAC